MAKYTEEQKTGIVDAVCVKIEAGRSLRSILKAFKKLPARKTFLDWISKDDDMRNQYACACEARQEFIFEEMLTISDKGKDPIRDRLKNDTRKWMLGKMNPKKYGDKVQTEHSGEIGVKQITGMDIK